MKIKKFFVFGVFSSFFMVSPFLGQGVADPSPKKGSSFKGMLQDASSFTLKNGMRFVVIPNRRAPVVVFNLVYYCGAGDDPAGKSGVAHLLEHLMFKGTKKYPDPEFKKIIARNGGSTNAFTHMDMTCYQVTLSSDRLEKLFELEADRMVNLAPLEKATAPELKVMLEEYQTRIGDNPEGQVHQAALALFSWNHPYHRHPAGWKSELTALTQEDALNFYKRWYAPNNAFCVVVGDVEESKVKALAETYFGSLSPKELSPRFWPEEPDHFNESVRLTMRHERLRQAEVEFMYPVPKELKKNRQQEDALEVLAQILGGGAHSRLYQTLVEEQKLSPPRGIGAAYVRFADPLGFMVGAHVLCLADLPLVESTLLVEIGRLMAQGVTEKELQQAKDRLILAFRKTQDDLGDVASGVVQDLVNGLSLEEIKTYEERIQAVTADQIKKVALLLFKDDPRFVQVILPFKKRETYTESNVKNGK